MSLSQHYNEIQRNATKYKDILRHTKKYQETLKAYEEIVVNTNLFLFLLRTKPASRSREGGRPPQADNMLAEGDEAQPATQW